MGKSGYSSRRLVGTVSPLTPVSSRACPGTPLSLSHPWVPAFAWMTLCGWARFVPRTVTIAAHLSIVIPGLDPGTQPNHPLEPQVHLGGRIKSGHDDREIGEPPEAPHRVVCALPERAGVRSFAASLGLTLITSESGQTRSLQNANALNSSLPKMRIVKPIE